MTAAIIGMRASWTYQKIYNIKRLFLLQMCTFNEIHVNLIHEYKKVVVIKPPSLEIFQVVQISQLFIMTNWLFFLSHPFTDFPSNNRRATLRIHVTSSCITQQPLTRNWCQQTLIDPILIGMPNLPAENIILIRTNQWQPWSDDSQRQNTRTGG